MYICPRKFKVGLLEMFEEETEKKEPLSESKIYFARSQDFERLKAIINLFLNSLMSYLAEFQATI